MKKLVAGLMTANATLFFFDAVQHAGIAIGTFSEPRIIPAALVESVCGLALAWGATALFAGWRSGRRAAIIANAIALAGVLLGMAALAAGAGPRTASNDLYHKVMLALGGFSLLMVLFAKRSTLKRM